MPDKIRVGIIGANPGYGWGLRAHIPALKALDDFEIAAVCTTREETASAAAKHFGIPLAFHDPAEMARHPDVDLVDVCVRVPYHHRMVMAALEAGKHVFCEWPLGADTAEAVEMRDLAEKRRVSNSVGLQARASPLFNYIRDLVAQQYIGRVLSCTMQAASGGAGSRAAGFAWAADPAKGANTMTIQAGHSIDALVFCLGEFEKVSGTVATQTREVTVTETGERIRVDSPDYVAVTGVLRSGALVSFQASSTPYRRGGFTFQINGTDGILLVTDSGNAQIDKHVLMGAKGIDKPLAEMPVPAEYDRLPSGVPQGPPFNVAGLLRRQAESIRARSAPAENFGVAVRLHELLDAIRSSSDTGLRQTF